MSTTWTERTRPTTTWAERDSAPLWSQSIYPWVSTFYPWQVDGIYTDWFENGGWNYIYFGQQTPPNSGWTTTTGATQSTRFTETTTNAEYRAVCSGVTGDERLDYTFPQAGALDFDTGVIVEWRAKYNISATGTSQSNFYVGDNNQIIRFFVINGSITLRTPTVILTDSSTDKTTYHTYKLVILGTSVSYYVDDVLVNTVTNPDTGGATNYVRILHRCAFSGATYDVSYDWIRVRRGTGTTVNTSWTERTQP